MGNGNIHSGINVPHHSTIAPMLLKDNNVSGDQAHGSSDHNSSHDVDMEPADSGVKQKNADNSKGKGKKTNAALDRQTKKQKLSEKEKLAKKTAAEMNKIYTPGECMKYMNIEGHPSLWASWYMADVPREVAHHGSHVIQTPLVCNPRVIVWTRTVPRILDQGDGQIALSPRRAPCNRALYIADAEELCEMVNAHTLSSHLAQIQQLCDCRLTLLVFKVDDYFKKKGRKQAASNSNHTPMTEINFELAITDLLVTADCDTVIANTASELALTILQFTKAIAEAPFKKAKHACDEKVAFYMRGDNKNCVAVDNDGVGVDRLWQQMLAVLPQSSLETSRAICAVHKSPLALYESLQSSDGIAQLADIGVSRAAVAGSRARRVGPEFARKLHTLFTATDGDQLIE